ncbi:MAG: succinate--CoA ligase subunit alpha [Bacteroidales bacterium]
MSILINQDTKVVVQGITGRDGSFHTARMKAYGTNVVAGTSPGKGGSIISNTPVYNTIDECIQNEGANTSVIFVPAAYAKDAMLESVNAGIKLIVCITEGIPTIDMIEVLRFAQINNSQIIGPNCPGIISPEKSLVGIMPGNIFKRGNTGVISRSGTLTYEIVDNLTKAGLGQSTAAGIGGDPVSGLYFTDLLRMFENDPETDSIALIGEIGGDAEEQAALFIKEHITKPVAVFIAGNAAPPDKKMGHAGAIISGSSGTASEKRRAFELAGIPVADKPSDIPGLLLNQLK